MKETKSRKVHCVDKIKTGYFLSVDADNLPIMLIGLSRFRKHFRQQYRNKAEEEECRRMNKVAQEVLRDRGLDKDARFKGPTSP